MLNVKRLLSILLTFLVFSTWVACSSSDEAGRPTNDGEEIAGYLIDPGMISISWGSIHIDGNANAVTATGMAVENLFINVFVMTDEEFASMAAAQPGTLDLPNSKIASFRPLPDGSFHSVIPYEDRNGHVILSLDVADSAIITITDHTENNAISVAKDLEDPPGPPTAVVNNPIVSAVTGTAKRILGTDAGNTTLGGGIDILGQVLGIELTISGSNTLSAYLFNGSDWNRTPIDSQVWVGGNISLNQSDSISTGKGILCWRYMIASTEELRATTTNGTNLAGGNAIKDALGPGLSFHNIDCSLGDDDVGHVLYQEWDGSSSIANLYVQSDTDLDGAYANESVISTSSLPGLPSMAVSFDGSVTVLSGNGDDLIEIYHRASTAGDFDSISGNVSISPTSSTVVANGDNIWAFVSDENTIEGFRLPLGGEFTDTIVLVGTNPIADISDDGRQVILCYTEDHIYCRYWEAGIGWTVDYALTTGATVTVNSLDVSISNNGNALIAASWFRGIQTVEVFPYAHGIGFQASSILQSGYTSPTVQDVNVMMSGEKGMILWSSNDATFFPEGIYYSVHGSPVE